MRAHLFLLFALLALCVSRTVSVSLEDALDDSPAPSNSTDPLAPSTSPSPSPSSATPSTTPSVSPSTTPSSVTPSTTPSSVSPSTTPSSVTPSTTPSSSPGPAPAPSTSPSPAPKDGLIDAKTYEIIHMSLGGFIILVGFIFIAAGYRLIKPILFLTGFILFFFIGFSLIHGFAQSLEEWIVLAIAGGIGLIGGILMIVIYKVGVFFAGLAAGSLFAALVISLTPLNPLLLRVLDDKIEMWVILAIVAGFGLLVGLLALKFVRPLTVISTSLFGAGLVISGSSMFPFIRETGVSIDALQSAFLKGSLPAFKLTNWVPYTLLGVYVLLTIVGVFVQFRLTAKNYRHKKKRRSRMNDDQGIPLLVTIDDDGTRR